MFVASRFMREKFIENGLPTEKMELLGFGIDTAWAANLPPRRFGSPLRIGFIGAFSPHKGAHILVEAFRRLNAGGRARLDLHGRRDFAPPFGDELKAAAAGVEGIHFRGAFPHQEIARVLGEMDVLLAALAARLPVIVSDMGGLTELVRDGENGLVTPAGDTAALGAALGRCLREPNLLPRLSRAVPPVKSIEACADELLARYPAAR